MVNMGVDDGVVFWNFIGVATGVAGKKSKALRDP
jgi:hypothetical protein